MSNGTEPDDCVCEPDRDGDYVRDCEGCGITRYTSHCPHDGVQNRCPECGWLPPDKRSPLEFLGFTQPPTEATA